MWAAAVLAALLGASAAAGESISTIQGSSFNLSSVPLAPAVDSQPADASGGSLAKSSAGTGSSPLPPPGSSWGSGAALATPRQDFRALVLEGGPLQGQVLAVGGCCSPSGSLSGCELLSPANRTWQPAGSLADARWLFQAVALPNGSALAIGGLGAGGRGVLASVELFGPSSSGKWAWTSAASMTAPRQDFEALTLADGRVLAVGGYMASSEVFDPAKNAWSGTMPMAEARSAFQAVRLANGSVLAIGGRGRDSGALASCELFDPASSRWSRAAPMRAARAYFAAALLPDGRVLVAGGKDAGGQSLNSSEIFDPKTGKWAAAPDMRFRRSELQAAALPDGSVLVVGGVGGAAAGDVQILDSAERFSPAAGGWAPTQPLADARYVFQLVVLRDGSVMALGGTGTKGFTGSTEIFGSS